MIVACIPALNEEGRIASVIVRAGRRVGAVVVRHGRNLGKGAAS